MGRPFADYTDAQLKKGYREALWTARISVVLFVAAFLAGIWVDVRWLASSFLPLISFAATLVLGAFLDDERDHRRRTRPRPDGDPDAQP